MVDAVTSVTNSLKTYMQNKKVQDIAWERLTADQIVQYVSEGQDAPLEIIRWAEEVRKLQDIPDNVTYASVNGASNADDIRDIQSQGEEPDAEDAAQKQTMTQAQQFRQSMELSGESKYNQGKALIGKSGEATSAETAMESGLDKNQETAEEIATVAELKSKVTENKTSSMKQELNRLLEKAQNKNENLFPADLNRIAELGGLLNIIGSSAQAELAQIGAQLTELEAEIQQFEAIPPTANDFGTETINVGSELLTGDKEKQTQITDAAKNANGINTAKVALNATKLKTFSILFDRNYRMGIRAVKAGGDAMDAGARGLSAIEAADSAINSEFGKVEGAQLRVENSTGVEGFTIPKMEEPDKQDETKTEEEKRAEEKDEKSGEVKTASSKTQENDVKDSTLVIDMDEKKKRREEQGLA